MLASAETVGAEVHAVAGEVPLPQVANLNGISQATAGLDVEVREDGVLGVGVGNRERLFAGAKAAFVDFVGVGGAPVVRRGNFYASGFRRCRCHVPIIRGRPAESTRSCFQLFTGCSRVVGKTASRRFLREPDRKGNSRSLAAIQTPSFDFNA